MAVQGIQPFIHVSDADGNPYVGAILYVYTAGTTTLKAIYSDDALSVSLANPLTSDAAGKFPRFYMAAGTYKLKATTSAAVELWTYDNLDTGLSAGSGALPISGGGTGATTAAGARANLGVPSDTEMTDLTTDVTDLTALIQNIVSSPQGYLTASSSLIIPVADVIAGTAVYYAPDKGNLCPIYNGAVFNIHDFAQLTLTLNSNHAANNIYDVFLALDPADPDVVLVITGPAWTTPTAGSCNRGTGAGTTELERVGGLFVNKNAMTGRNGATTYSIDAQKATFVGSIFMDATNGELTCHRSVGASRKWGISNAYNRRKITLGVTDSTASWTYNVATFRASRAQTTNSLTTFTCLPDEEYACRFTQAVNGGAATQPQIGIGWNSTTVVSGKQGTGMSPSTGPLGQDIIAEYVNPPAFGINVVTALEAPTTAAAVTYVGTSASMLLSASWFV